MARQGAYERTDSKALTDQSSGHFVEVRAAEGKVPDGQQRFDSVPPVSVQGL